MTTGTIRLCLDLTDPWQRAKLSVNMAEQRLEDMKMMPDKVASTDSTISTVIKAVDRVKDIADTVAEVSPVLSSHTVEAPNAVTLPLDPPAHQPVLESCMGHIWGASKVLILQLSIANAVLLQVITYQFRTDAMLVDMATKMKDAFRLSAEARSLDDRTKTLLRSKIKSLLNEIAQCSRFLQEYANCSPAGKHTDRDLLFMKVTCSTSSITSPDRQGQDRRIQRSL